MTEFLVNKFIKDSANIESTEVRTRYGMLASVVGIFCNVLLFSVKLAIGLILSSLAVTADAFNNLSDAASSIISFVGVKMAGKPADAEHPFGHGRIEYIAALIVSFLVIEVGFTFFKSSISKIMHPEEITFDPVEFYLDTADGTNGTFTVARMPGYISPKATCLTLTPYYNDFPLSSSVNSTEETAESTEKTVAESTEIEVSTTNTDDAQEISISNYKSLGKAFTITIH